MTRGLYSGDADHFEPLLSAEGPVIGDQFTTLVAPADDRVLYVNKHQLMQAERSGGPGSLWQTRPLVSAARIVEHPELAAVQALIDAGDGRLWFGCGERLCALAGQQLTVYGAAAGVPAAEYGALLRDGAGNIWARSQVHLVRLSHNASRFEIIDPPHVLLANRVRRLTLALDPMGRVVTRTSLGLARWDQTAWAEFGPQNGLPDHPIAAAVCRFRRQFLVGRGRHRPVSLAWV